MKLFVLILKNLRRNLLRTTLTSLGTMVLVLVVTLIWSILWFLDSATSEKSTHLKAIVTEKWQIPSQLPISYAQSLSEGAVRNPGDVKPVDSMTWQFFVGTLDGKVFSIGGKWYGKVRSEHADPRLLVVLKLFCGMLIFNDEARRHMRRLAREVASGRYVPKLEKQESDLYMNPRRVR